MAGKDNDSRGTNALLAEILEVLRRMDGRLKVQDERIGLLETTVATVKQDGAILGKIATNVSSQLSAEAYSPTAVRQLVPRLNAAARLGLGKSDGLHGRRSSAWTDHQDVINQLRRESTHGHQDENGENIMQRSNSLGRGIFKQKMWDTLSLPSMNLDQEGTSGHVALDNSASYAEYPPPPGWISTRVSGKLLGIKYGLPEAEKLWNGYVGDSWTIPPDGRVEMSFQRHLLERLDKDHAESLLKLLTEVTNRLEYQDLNDRAKRGSFLVSDFDFDPNYEESGMDYRSEFFTGMYKEGWLSSPRMDRPASSSTACWKRMIEIRGLSRKLIDKDRIIEMETTPELNNDPRKRQPSLTYSSDRQPVLRDPWAEALPKLNTIFPFFTEREESLHFGDLETSQTIDRVLEYHQRCLPYTPSKEDNLCFHIVFYELVSLREDEQLEDEIWKYGKLHSDDVRTRIRRLRESACTIIVIPDPDQPNYWTSLYLCPFNFDPYEKKPDVIATQDAPSVAADMVEFTIRVLINRWVGIAEYFAWLIGHRDALADPEIHDSLLFDDASFSRSRRYFWAINYLAELDENIAGNILQLERWITMWPQHLTVGSKEINAEVRSLPERLNELMALQLRLKALRQEAIALRDGLFSASGVIESRAATRLGENVKLLTFVSIFFLPLSFCMSMWSINDAIFSLSSLVIVAILIPFGTYFVVFNLNNLVRMSGRTYKKYKRKLVLQMKEDENIKWSEQGKRFETFRPRAERVEPSDWMIGFFVMYKCVKAIGLGNLFSRKTLRKTERRETQSEEHELDFSILNGPKTAAKGNSAGHRSQMPPGHNTFLKGFSKLSFKFRRGAIVPGSTAGV